MAASFSRVTLDARRYQSLGSPRHVLALHGLGSFDQPDTGSRVPFYLQSALGGAHVLRGFRPFRFRDEDLLALSGEYRFELRPKVELAAFYDAGKVTSRRSDLDFDGLKNDFGLGFRFHGPFATPLRIEVAKSREGIALVFASTPIF